MSQAVMETEATRLLSALQEADGVRVTLQNSDMKTASTYDMTTDYVVSVAPLAGDQWYVTFVHAMTDTVDLAFVVGDASWEMDMTDDGIFIMRHRTSPDDKMELGFYSNEKER